MDLYVLRHAIAVPREDESVSRDSARPLTERGRAKLRRVTRGMRALGLSFDLVLTSPYRRARETADIVAAAMGAKKTLEPTPHLAPDGDPRELIELLRSRGREAASVLVVGHEPYLSQLVSVLASGEERTDIAMKKAGLCKLAIRTLRYGRCASIEWLLPPAHLARIR
jgi:phosphohistidine phosphatase